MSISNIYVNIFHSSRIKHLLFLFPMYSIILFKQSENLNIQNNILLITVSVYFLFSLWNAYKCNFKFDFIDVLVIIFYIYLAFLNFDINKNGFNSQYSTIQLFFLTYFILRVQYKGGMHETLSLFFIFISSILLSLIGIGQILGILSLTHSLFSATGTFFNPGPYACFLSTTTVMAIIYLTSNHLSILNPLKCTKCKGDRTFRLTLYVLGIVSTILSIIILPFANSRSSLLGLVIPLSIYIFHSLKKNRIGQIISKKTTTYRYCFFIIGFIALIISLYFIRPESANGRLHIWKISLSNLNNSVIFGSGIGTFPKQYIIAQEKYYEKNDRFEIESRKYADTPSYAFNEYLHILIETGIIGLSLFLLILYLIIKQQFLDRDRLFGYGNLSILIISLTSYPFHLLPFLLLITTILSVRKQGKQMPFKFTIISLILMAIIFYSSTPSFYKEINATIKWKKLKEKQELSLLEIRNESQFLELYETLKNNHDYLLDYGIYLRNKMQYETSNHILFQGYTISNNPDFALLLAKNYSALGCTNKSEYYYNITFKMLPNRIYPLYCLALQYYDTKQYTKFMELSKIILNFTPKIISVRTNEIKNEIEYLRNDLLETNNYTHIKNREKKQATDKVQ